jgi:hypothetical protein
MHEDLQRSNGSITVPGPGLGTESADIFQFEKDFGSPAYLKGEVHMPRSVNDVDAVVLAALCPETCGGCGSDGDSALLLLNHPAGVSNIRFKEEKGHKMWC